MKEEIPGSATKESISTFIELMPIGVLIVRKGGEILSANTAICNILTDGQPISGKHRVSDFIPMAESSIHAGHMDKFFSNPKQRKMGSGSQLYAKTLSQKSIPIEIGLNPITIDGEFCVAATVIDMTERLESLSLFEKSLKVSPHGTIIVDSNGLITTVNNSICSTFGYSEEQIVGENIDFLLPERYRENHKDLIKHYWESPTIRRMGKGRDLTALHSDGKEFPVEIGLSPINHIEKTALVTLTDITNRKILEQELKETNTNLEEFTYIASHDLRSPLRGISDLVSWIREDLGDDVADDVSHNLDRISTRVERMETLIENLLSYARAGRVSQELVKIDIEELVDSVLSFINPPEHFSIDVDIQSREIMASKTPMETVLRNLISNSIKHYDRTTGGTISISVSEEGNMMRFSVKDNGPGVPAKSRERIFKLFQTASSSERGTTGVGLSVCRRLVETHGGYIDVQSSGELPGSEFIFWWPRFIRKDKHE